MGKKREILIEFASLTISVRPPKKSWKNITNLSGGEKTLSSLALVFALHYYRPTPLYVMDEIDAALDFKNVSIVGYYIKVCLFFFLFFFYNFCFYLKHAIILFIGKNEKCSVYRHFATDEYVRIGAYADRYL